MFKRLTKIVGWQVSYLAFLVGEATHPGPSCVGYHTNGTLRCTLFREITDLQERLLVINIRWCKLQARINRVHLLIRDLDGVLSHPGISDDSAWFSFFDERRKRLSAKQSALKQRRLVLWYRYTAGVAKLCSLRHK